MVLSNACGMLTVNHIHQLCQNCLSSTADLVYTHLLPDPVNNLKLTLPPFTVSNVSWELVCKHNTKIKATFRDIKGCPAPTLPVSNTQTKERDISQQSHLVCHENILSQGGERVDPFVTPVHECTC